MTCASYLIGWVIAAEGFPLTRQGTRRLSGTRAAARTAFSAARLSGAELGHRARHFGAGGGRRSRPTRVSDRADQRAEGRKGIDGKDRRRRVRKQHPLLLVRVKAAGRHWSAVETAGRKHLHEVGIGTLLLDFDTEIRLPVEGVEDRRFF